MPQSHKKALNVFAPIKTENFKAGDRLEHILNTDTSHRGAAYASQPGMHAGIYVGKVLLCPHPTPCVAQTWVFLVPKETTCGGEKQ